MFRGECQEQILKFAAARYKKFATKELAQSFIDGSDNPAEGISLVLSLVWVTIEITLCWRVMYDPSKVE